MEEPYIEGIFNRLSDILDELIKIRVLLETKPNETKTDTDGPASGG
jgi:hypothetical protein